MTTVTGTVASYERRNTPRASTTPPSASATSSKDSRFLSSRNIAIAGSAAGVGALLTIAVGMLIYCCVRWRRRRQVRRHVEFQFHETLPKNTRSLDRQSRSRTCMFSRHCCPLRSSLRMADTMVPQWRHVYRIIEKQPLTYRHRLLLHTHLPARTKRSSHKRSWVWG